MLINNVFSFIIIKRSLIKFKIQGNYNKIGLIIYKKISYLILFHKIL